MIKVGDKVAHFMYMNKVGIVTEITLGQGSMMTAGGTMSNERSIATITLPSGEKVKYHVSDLMKVYD